LQWGKDGKYRLELGFRTNVLAPNMSYAMGDCQSFANGSKQEAEYDAEQAKTGEHDFAQIRPDSNKVATTRPE
jgi:hypothetical protein